MPPNIPQETDEIKLSQVLLQKLNNPIPEQFVTKYETDGKTFSGYNAQYAINLLNKEIGLGNWDTMEEILKQDTLSKGWAIAMSVKIIIRKEGLDKDIYVIGYGGAYSRDIANAYKGAKTSAFKNACKYLGIGNELYLEGFDEEIKEIVYEKPIPEVADSTNELMEKIKSCDKLETLELLTKEIQSIDGESVKKVLLSSYNKKKIELMEGNH